MPNRSMNGCSSQSTSNMRKAAALTGELNKFRTAALVAQQTALLEALFKAWSVTVLKKQADADFAVNNIVPMVKWLEEKDRRDKKIQAPKAPKTGQDGIHGLSDNDDDEDMGGGGDEMDVAWGELKEAYHKQVRTARNVRLGAEEVPWDAVMRLGMDFQNFKPQTGVLCP